MKKEDKRKIKYALFIPVLFLVILWIIKIIEYSFEMSFLQYGVFPKKISGIKGVFLSAFIHKDFNHLLNNSYPILVLGSMLFGFYKDIALKIFIYLLLVSGLLLWLIGRPAFHIGASGFIYALASFLFFSGFIRKNTGLSAISFVVIFLYGSMIWGVFPIEKFISWEGHLSGLITGLIMAFIYKDQGPKKTKYDWEIEEENEAKTTINYIIKNDLIFHHTIIRNKPQSFM